MTAGPVRLGLGANWRQFALLVAVTAFVGAMVGLERSILPAIAEREFGITSKAAAVSFIATFSVAKAVANLIAGSLSEEFSRRKVLIAGWLLGLPVPFMLIYAPTWGWVIGANALLGLNQGLAWSMTLNMKADLVGPSRRGLALGFNEAAGYLGLAAAAFLTGVLAQEYGLRPEPFYLGIAFAAVGLGLSVLFARDTKPLVAIEAGGKGEARPEAPRLGRSFADVTWRRPHLFSVAQAGLVKNLNDGLAWGIFPIFFATKGVELDRIAALAAIYPLVWGTLQLATGWASDLVGRKPLIVGGMVLQGLAISAVGVVNSFTGWTAAVSLLGAGTAMVYPTLQAAIGDAVAPGERAMALGVYRFWRDVGAMVGALVAGSLADSFGFGAAIQSVAALTAGSGVLAGLMMRGRRR